MAIHRLCNNCLEIIAHNDKRFILSEYNGLPVSRTDLCSKSCLQDFINLLPEFQSQLNESKAKKLVAMRQ